MRRFVIHCTSVAGHHLEYIHHLYIGLANQPDSIGFFIVPNKFYHDKDLYVWPQANNIYFKELDDFNGNAAKQSLLKKSYKKSQSLKEYIRKYDATDVILIDIINYLPFLPFFVSPKIRVRGILYRIYLYEWKVSRFDKKMADVLKYLLFSKFKVFDRVFILNDSTSAIYLNKLYKTDKFKYLPDPVASFSNYSPIDVRKKYGIASDKIIFLHPGGMLPYKGTIEILKALSMMSVKQLAKLTIIFAGKITPYIREEFWTLYNTVIENAHLVLIEGFLSFEDLADLFYTCDYVLIPYKVKSQSSGIMGHAAFYNKPVVVAKGGVIGKTVAKYHLGLIIKEASPHHIKEFLSSPIECVVKGDGYVSSHSISMFNELIYKLN